MDERLQSQYDETPSRSSVRFLKRLLADYRKYSSLFLIRKENQQRAEVLPLSGEYRNPVSLFFSRRGVRAVLSLLSPAFFAAIQLAIWPTIRPFAWFFFYPAVLVSSWLGGLKYAITSSLIAAFFVWWKFIPPEHTLAKDLRYLLSAAMYISFGTLFAVIQDRLRRAKHDTEDALNSARLASESALAAEDQTTRLFEQASDGIFVADTSGRITAVNRAGCQMLGYSREEVCKKSIFDLVAVNEIPRLERAAAQMLEGKSQLAEWTLRRKDGTEVPVEVSSNILPDGRWQSFVRDITELKNTREHLLRSYRANRALSRCNQALVRALDEESLLQQICDVVVQEAGYRLCWVGRAEHDEAKSVTAIAQAGVERGYLDTLHLTWGDSEFGKGPTGICIRTGKASIVKAIATNARFSQWRAQALERGYASSIAIPIFVGAGEDAEVFGAFNIYASEPDAFDAEEVELLTELVNDLSFGITSLRIRVEHAKAEKDLRELNAELEERVLARTTELQTANQLKDGLILREQKISRELAASQEREAEIGNRIQQTLLLDPPPVDIPGLRVAALTIPTERIDGDFYIFIKHHDGSLDVIVGDVMGKGTAAALLGAATKAYFLKALSHLVARPKSNKIPEPREIVMLAHAHIARQLIDLESFVTLCYARINVTAKRLDLVDCGHTGVLQFSGQTGRHTVLHGDNLPLGVRVSEIYEQFSTACDPGDLLVFFSDGITEARNPSGEAFGLDRLIQCVQENLHFEPNAIVECIRKAVLEFSESAHFNDDLTSVVLRIEEVEVPIAHEELKIRSDLRELNELRGFVRKFCSGLSPALLQISDIDELELAVHEAACNVIKHAYHGRIDQQIEIEGQAFPGRVSILIHHLGESFDPSAVPKPVFDGSRESGLGLYIMAQCTDDIRYFRDERGRNCIALTKRVRNSSYKESERLHGYSLGKDQ